MAGVQLFSDTADLKVNSGKSAFYACGMKAQEIEKVKETSSFNQGALPFKYRGVPITAKQLPISDWRMLIDKMC